MKLTHYQDTRLNRSNNGSSLAAVLFLTTVALTLAAAVMVGRVQMQTNISKAATLNLMIASTDTIVRAVQAQIATNLITQMSVNIGQYFPNGADRDSDNRQQSGLHSLLGKQYVCLYQRRKRINDFPSGCGPDTPDTFHRRIWTFCQSVSAIPISERPTCGNIFCTAPAFPRSHQCFNPTGFGICITAGHCCCPLVSLHVVFVAGSPAHSTHPLTLPQSAVLGPVLARLLSARCIPVHPLSVTHHLRSLSPARRLLRLAGLTFQYLVAFPA